jgi:hypothetical protein
MKAYRVSQAPRFFEGDLYVQWLAAKNKSLSCLDAVIDEETFRPLLDAVWDKPAKSPVGNRPLTDAQKKSHRQKHESAVEDCACVWLQESDDERIQFRSIGRMAERGGDCVHAPD